MNKHQARMYLCFTVCTMLVGSSVLPVEVYGSPTGLESEKQSGSSGVIGQDHTSTGQSSSDRTKGSSGSMKQDPGSSGNIGRPNQPKAGGEGTLNGPARTPDSNRSTTGKGSGNESNMGSGSGSMSPGGMGSSGSTGSSGGSGGGY